MQAAPCDLPLSPIGMPVRRSHARARLHLGARLVTFTSTSDCVVIDLSCTGARIAAAAPVRVGAMVVIEGIPVELFGTVRWVSTSRFGFAFDTPLALEQVVAMRRHADAAPEEERRAHLEYARRWTQGR